MENNQLLVMAKLQKARAKLIEKGVKPTGYNKHSRFGYFELDDFLPQAMSIFAELGLYSEFNLIETVVQVGEDQFLREKATLEVFDTESGSSRIYETPSADVKIGVNKQGEGGAQAIQNLGGKHSYLKRYLYRNVLELAESDPVDAQPQDPNNGDQGNNQEETFPMIKYKGEEVEGCSLQQGEIIKAYYDKDEKLKKDLFSYLEVKGYMEIPRANANGIIKKIRMVEGS